MSIIKKYVNVPVDTPKGRRCIKFFRYSDEDNKRRPCEGLCSYSAVCESLPDPSHLEDKDKGFLDFCGNLGMGEDGEELENLIDVIPAPESIEEALGDICDPYQELIKREKMVKIGKVIDVVCSGGFCSRYLPDHSRCTYENKSCILRPLFFSGRGEEEKSIPLKK